MVRRRAGSCSSVIFLDLDLCFALTWTLARWLASSTMKSFLPGALVALLVSLSTFTNAQNTSTTVPVIDLGYVKYSGYQNTTAGIRYYRGIRYAAAPTGELRWAKPVPIESANNYSGRIVNASTLGPACYQSSARGAYSAPSAPQGQSEDCLLLDVLVPSKPVSTALPVLFT